MLYLRSSLVSPFTILVMADTTSFNLCESGTCTGSVLGKVGAGVKKGYCSSRRFCCRCMWAASAFYHIGPGKSLTAAACSFVILRFILTKISDLYAREREILSVRAWPCGAPSELLRIKVFKVNLLYRFACLRRDWDVFGARCRGFEPIPSCDHLGQTLLLLLLQGAANTPKNNTRERCPM